MEERILAKPMASRLVLGAVAVIGIVSIVACGDSPTSPTTINVAPLSSEPSPVVVTGITQTAAAADPCKRYQLVEGKFTQAQAWAEATRRKGRPLVISDRTEFTTIVRCFNLPRRSAYHLGHYQDKKNMKFKEPAGGWVTVTKENGYWPWNGQGNGGPDDGCQNRWDWELVDGGMQVGYGKSCKGEQAAVLWTDNGGRLEDVSVNHRGGVIVEF